MEIKRAERVGKRVMGREFKLWVIDCEPHKRVILGELASDYL